MAGQSRFSDDDLIAAVQQIVDEGVEPSINLLLARCSVGRNRAQAALKSWHIAQSEMIVREASIPTEAIDTIVDTVKSVFSPLVLKERQEAKDKAEERLTALSKLLDEGTQSLADMEAESQKVKQEAKKIEEENGSLKAAALTREGKISSLTEQLESERARADELTIELAKLKEENAALIAAGSDEQKGKVEALSTELEREKRLREEAEGRERTAAANLAVAEAMSKQNEEKVTELTRKIDEYADVIAKRDKEIVELKEILRQERTRYGSVCAALDRFGITVERKNDRRKNKYQKNSPQESKEHTSNNAQKNDKRTIEQGEKQSEGQVQEGAEAASSLVQEATGQEGSEYQEGTQDLQEHEAAEYPQENFTFSPLPQDDHEKGKANESHEGTLIENPFDCVNSQNKQTEN